jgi:hypothetical protein
MHTPEKNSQSRNGPHTSSAHSSDSHESQCQSPNPDESQSPPSHHTHYREIIASSNGHGTKPWTGHTPSSQWTARSTPGRADHSGASGPEDDDGGGPPSRPPPRKKTVDNFFTRKIKTFGQAVVITWYSERYPRYPQALNLAIRALRLLSRCGILLLIQAVCRTPRV